MSRRKSHERGPYSHRVFRVRSAAYKARRKWRRAFGSKGQTQGYLMSIPAHWLTHQGGAK